jgi:phosphate acetyltransferase
MLQTNTVQVIEQSMIAGLDAWPRLAQLLERAGDRGGVRTGVVYPLSLESLRSACEAHRIGLMVAVLYGPSDRIKKLALQHGVALADITLIDTPDNPLVCAQLAVADCQRGGTLKALMKGSLHTDELLAAVVSKTTGLRTNRRISHMFVFDVPRYHKLLIVADAVVNIAPDMKFKQSIVQNTIDAAQKLGISQPKVALLAAIENVLPSIAATEDAQVLVNMATAGQITGGLLAGPFGFDNAISQQAALIKGIKSEVAGDADILIAPDLNAGNILYKSLIYMAGAECAGVVLGAVVPIILTSRSDSETSRIASCALASMLA